MEPKLIPEGKFVLVDGKQFKPGYPACQGCENLTVGNTGWFCAFNPETSECEYPDTFRDKEAK